MRLPCPVVACGNRLTINSKSPISGLQKPHNNIEQGTFTTACYPDKTSPAFPLEIARLKLLSTRGVCSV
jgi:hypothetical protein